MQMPSFDKFSSAIIVPVTFLGVSTSPLEKKTHRTKKRELKAVDLDELSNSVPNYYGEMRLQRNLLTK